MLGSKKLPIKWSTQRRKTDDGLGGHWLYWRLKRHKHLRFVPVRQLKSWAESGEDNCPYERKEILTHTFIQFHSWWGGGKGRAYLSWSPWVCHPCWQRGDHDSAGGEGGDQEREIYEEKWESKIVRMTERLRENHCKFKGKFAIWIEWSSNFFFSVNFDKAILFNDSHIYVITLELYYSKYQYLIKFSWRHFGELENPRADVICQFFLQDGGERLPDRENEEG